MNRVVVWCWPKDPSLAPIEALEKSGEIEVVAWFSRGRKKTHLTKHFSYQPDLLLKDVRATPPDKRYTPDIPADEFALEFQNFQDLYSRVNYSKGQDYFQHLNLFHLYYQYFTRMLMEGQVDTVIFFSIPHVGPDMVLYRAARRLGLRTRINIQSPVPNRFFSFETIEDFGKFTEGDPGPAELSLTIPKKHEAKIFYMQNLPDKKGWMLSRFVQDCYFATFGGRQPISWGGVVQKLLGRISFTRRYRQNAQDEADLTKKFVYFPLHLQPEMTTSVLGGPFSDQLLALEKISRLIPDDWHIYVKENPLQAYQQRGQFFFERLARIPNCHYLSSKVNTFDLIGNSQFVASVTGTACWEAARGGKPAILFGHVWFRGFPGILSWTPKTTLDDILGQEFTHADIETAYNKVMSKTHEGIIERAYIEIHPDFSEEANGELLIKFLRKMLSGTS